MELLTMRNNLVFAWLAAISGVVIFMAFGQAAPEKKVTSFDEINVRRINIVEADGKPRVIISSRDRMAGLYWNGKEYRHPTRDEGGFLFFNDDGTEVGGMTFSNRKQGDQYSASSNLLFDQYQQDQTLGLTYREQSGQREVGLRVWDRPDKNLLPIIELSDKLARASTDAERTRIRAEIDALAKTYYPDGKVAERFFAGKQLGASVVKLADKKGQPRLVLKVDEAGTPSVEFLDAAGKVVRRIPE
jgi:hypothetical protein